MSLPSWRAGKVMVHRFVKRRKHGERWWFCEAGDNLAGWQWLPGGKVLGKVVLIQGAGGAVKLDTRPWTWVNSFLGFVLAFSVSLCEDFQEAKFPVFLQQGAWALHRINKKMLRTISRIFLVRRGSHRGRIGSPEDSFCATIQGRNGKHLFMTVLRDSRGDACFALRCGHPGSRLDRNCGGKVTDEQNTIIRTVLAHYPDTQGIYLFGSYATLDEGPQSDVDLALLLPPRPAKSGTDLALSQCRLALADCSAQGC